MRILGETCLLVAFVATGYAAVACISGRLGKRPGLHRVGVWAGCGALLALTVTLCTLAAALLAKDFSFQYVAHYSSRLLPWYYSLSALWVGQAGSLLLWAWLMTALAVVFRFIPVRRETSLRDTAFGVLMSYVCFLVAIMVFAADPMQASIGAPEEGFGLSPLLQHPSMLIHPPIVFAGYAAWAVPFSLATAALLTGRLDRAWAHQARPWGLVAWLILGSGILVGASWAYQELGWGGYWGWDPVENGSLMPWLTGTALLHCLMAWRHRGCLKKTAIWLAIITFGLCNYATFLTRSGIFSSVHAFSESPIGWMFLALLVLLLGGGGWLVWKRRRDLLTEHRMKSLLARETVIVCSTLLLVLLTSVMIVGTTVIPVSTMLTGRTIQFGAEFYNNVLIPIGLSLLAATAAAPLLRWGGPPTATQGKVLSGCVVVALAVAAVALVGGFRHPISLLVAGLTALAISSMIAAFLLETLRRRAPSRWSAALQVARSSRRQYGGYIVHLGFVCLAVGITGSSLGNQRNDTILHEGDELEWAGRRIRYVQLIQRELPDKLVAEAELEVSRGEGEAVTLLPAKHLHLLQNEWTSEVAIHSTWRGDFYTILHGGLGGGAVSLTLIDNPLMRWLWLGGGISACGALLALWPSRRTRQSGRGKKPSDASKPSDDRMHEPARAA